VSVENGLTVGIINSYDNTLEAACRELGLSHALLDLKDPGSLDLSKWSTIIVDIRAYLVREILRCKRPAP